MQEWHIKLKIREEIKTNINFKWKSLKRKNYWEWTEINQQKLRKIELWSLKIPREFKVINPRAIVKCIKIDKIIIISKWK